MGSKPVGRFMVVMVVLLFSSIRVVNAAEAMGFASD